eukprot:gene38403-51875_t
MGTTRTMPLIDGGVFANDPALSAYVEGRQLDWGEQDIASRKIPYNQAKDWGAAGWISPAHHTALISVLMQGQASTASYLANALLNAGKSTLVDGATVFSPADRKSLRYFRIDGSLTSADVGPSDALDDATEGNILKLETFGQRLAEKHSDALDEIADRPRHRSDDLIDHALAGILLGDGDRLPGKRGDLAHAEAQSHELLAKTHDAAARKAGQEA